MAKRSRAAVRAAAESAMAQFRTAAPGAATLGDLLFWDFSSGWRGLCSDVRDVWIAAGLDPDTDLPAPIDRDTAFSRAVLAAKIRAGSQDCRVESCAATADGSRRVAIVQLRRNGTVSGETIGVVVCPAEGSDPVRVETPDTHGLARGIVDDTASTYANRYTTDDLRSAVVSVLDRWAATPCRQTQPHIVYWLPSPGGPTIRMVRDALARLGAGEIHLAPMGLDAESRETAASAANGGLEASLTALLAEVDQWASKSPGRTSTIEARIAESEKLRTTAELYRGVLGEAVRSVEARIDSLISGQRRILGIVEAAKEARV
jgi:hypothetical protein